MNLFYEGDLRSFLQPQLQKLRTEVDSQDQNYLLNVNETQLIAHLTEKYRLDPLVLNEDAVYVTEKATPCDP